MKVILLYLHIEIFLDITLKEIAFLSSLGFFSLLFHDHARKFRIVKSSVTCQWGNVQEINGIQWEAIIWREKQEKFHESREVRVKKGKIRVRTVKRRSCVYYRSRDELLNAA